MNRWVRAWGAGFAAGAVLGGALGLAEAASQWLRFGPPLEQPGTGALRWILPTAGLYAALGGVLAATLLPPLALVLGRRPAPRRAAFAAGVGGSLALLLAPEAGYLLREHLLSDWWAAHGLGAGRVLLGGVTALAAAVAVPLAYGWARRLARARRGAWALGLAAALALAPLALWPHWRAQEPARRIGHLGPTAAAPAGSPNLLLVTIDAWRRDHLALLGPLSPPTPALDALARDGTLYENAWSAAPWTLPSMGAMLTGLPPRALDLRKYRPLPAAVPTLAEAAHRAGWVTAAFATNPYLSTWYGFDRGFGDFEHSLFLEPLLPAERAVLVRELQRHLHARQEPESADVVVPKAQRWLRRHGSERPFFLWLHLMNPHLPYRWRELPPPAAVPDGLGVVPDPAAVPADGWFAGRAFSALRPVRQGQFVPSEAEWRAIATLYAREVQFADAWVGRLLAELDALGLKERTVIVVTADHGEELNDHGGFEHGHSLRPEVTAVPLIVRRPGGPRGARSAAAVSTLDLVPSCAGWFGWSVPAEAVGRPLPDPATVAAAPPSSPAASAAASPDVSTGAAPAAGGPERLLVLEGMLYGPPQLGLLAWPWLGVGPAGPDTLAWYDLAGDPGARRRTPAPPAGAAWRAAAAVWQADWDRLAASLRAGEKPGGGVPPDDVRRRLESLGY